MCGIFGYVGKEDAAKHIINGLKRLEYRGYDSWGIAIINKDNIEVTKKVGAIGDLNSTKWPKSNLGVGHTRWATHGGVTELNAHPHYSSDKSFVLAQNGIVENFRELKNELSKKGYEFKSETDTEVIVRLVEQKLKNTKSLKEAVRQAFLDLEGRNTIIVLSIDKNKPNDKSNQEVIAIKNGSPLVVGVGEGEYFFASDTLSFANQSDKVIFINNFEMVTYKNEEINLYDATTGKKLSYEIKEIDHEEVKIDKEGYDHFMLKEIVEQKDTIRNAVQYSKQELKPLLEAVRKAETIYTVGAGTASYEAGQAAYYLRNTAGIKAIELKSYEINAYKNLFKPNDLIIAFSQSGETADTIEAIEIAKEAGLKVSSIVNMVGSTLTRMSDHPYFVRSGPEICVCSTKAFTGKLAWSLLVANSLINKHEEAKEDIIKLSNKLQNYFDEKLLQKIKNIAKNLQDKEHAFILGRGQNYYITLEAALKIKEISYLHAEGFAGGELKHGVIALIEEGTPVFALMEDDEEKADMLSAVAEVKARGAWTIGVGEKIEGQFDDFIETPRAEKASNIGNVIPFQLISYYLALNYGYNPDKPRNLAKSVTVK